MRDVPQMFISTVLFLFGTHSVSVDAYRIVGVFPYAVKSHFIMTEAIMKGLAAKGHDVIVISPFPQREPVENYTDISLADVLGNVVSQVPLSRAERYGGAILLHHLMFRLSMETCEKTFADQKVQELLASGKTFDLVIIEAFFLDCFLVFPHVLRSPFVAVSTSSAMAWTNDWFGNPVNPAYVPVNMLPHADKMTFLERAANMAFLLAVKAVYRHAFQPRMEAIVKKYFGESVPTLEEMSRNASLCLLNTHFSLNQPRPMLPSIVEVAGLHMKKPNPLPEDMERFISESPLGVVYFSLGSTLRGDSLPEQYRRSFLDAFSELPQRVLWKWEADSLSNRTANVKIAKWMPQLEILSHHNVKAFITHGGLMGTMEAAYFGVPMVAIPMFGDQHHNVRSYIEEGITVQLDYWNISKESVLAAIKTVLDNPSYAENAKRVSKALRDRPMAPLDTAIYWIEYVIRHRGAPHLRSAAVDLTWYQYLLLDVMVVLLLGLVLVVVAAMALLRVILRCMQKIINVKEKEQ